MTDVTQHVTTKDLTCPWCGTVEDNEYSLSNNHWHKGQVPEGEYDWATAHGMCIAQNLLGNHIRYYVRQILKADDILHSRRRVEHLECMGKELRRSMKAAREHRVDVDAILAEFPGLTCRPCQRGKHERCLGDATWNNMTDEQDTCACQHKGEES